MSSEYTPLRAQTGSGVRELRADLTTHALTTIDYAHHEIHGGSAFVLCQRTALNDLDIASPLTFFITTPAGSKLAHMDIEVDMGAQGFVEIFEDTGEVLEFNVSGGTPITPLNRNRSGTPAASVLTVTTGATVTKAEAAARIYDKSVAALLGGEGNHSHEWVLAANKKYLVRLTTFADNNEGSLTLEWYEHTNRT